MNEHNNGYMAMARYNVRTSRVSEAEAKPDMNEAFFIKRERGADDPLAGRRFAGPNRWPETLPGFRETVLDYCETVDRLALSILPALSLSLGLPEDWFDPHFTRSQFSFRLSHYPPAEREPGRYGIAPHTDTNFLTFLAQSGVPGLQIRREGGGWEDVPFVEDSFVVNTGDMLHRWTNGRYKSTPHRAQPPRGPAPLRHPLFLRPQSRRRNPLRAHLHRPGQPAPLAPRHLRGPPRLVVRRQLQRRRPEGPGGGVAAGHSRRPFDRSDLCPIRATGFACDVRLVEVSPVRRSGLTGLCACTQKMEAEALRGRTRPAAWCMKRHAGVRLIECSVSRKRQKSNLPDRGLDDRDIIPVRRGMRPSA